MSKIPVGETVAHAYGFATGQFLKILGIVWAPLVVSAAVGLMAMPGFLGNHTPLNDLDEIRRQSMRLSPFIFVFSLFIRAMIGVGVTELALGKRTGTTFVYFSVGAPVWRLIGAWLLFLLVIILIYIGLLIVTVAVGVVGGIGVKSLTLATGANNTAIGLLVIACVVIFAGTLFYTMARLTFLIPPVVVDEKQVDLARGWQLTRGSFWRIFAIGLAIFVPLILFQIVIAGIFFGVDFLHQFADIMRGAFHGATEAVVQQRMNLWSGAVRARALQVWPYTVVIGIFLETFAYGLLYGAAAFAYRAVNPPPATGMRSGPV
ncbi:MAG TPA: hypothetical protein VID67_01775 [Rhizomicrobium sp.]|jgi:hypothetical protein